MCKEKSTITVEEDDILKISEKIKQNAKEDEDFSKNLKAFLNGETQNSSPITIGKTPFSLCIAGTKSELNLIISPRTIIKCMSKPENYYHGHDLSQEILQQIPRELRNPVMVFKGSEKSSLVAITELKDNQERGIMVSVTLSASEKRCEVNRISSVYGRNNFVNYINKQISNGNLIALNKEKANNMFQSLGLQSPPEETYISFDNSISYSTQNVNVPKEKCKIITKEQATILKKSDIPFEMKFSEGKFVIRYKEVFDKAVKNIIDKNPLKQSIKR